MDYLAYIAALGFVLAGSIGVVLVGRYRPTPWFAIPATAFLFVNAFLIFLPGIALDAIGDPLFQWVEWVLESAGLLLLAAMLAGLLCKGCLRVLLPLLLVTLAPILLSGVGWLAHGFWTGFVVLCALTCLSKSLRTAGHIRLFWMGFAGAFLFLAIPVDPGKIVWSFFEGQLVGTYFSFRVLANSASAALWFVSMWLWYRVETWERLALRPLGEDQRFTSSRSLTLIATTCAVLVMGYPALDLISKSLEDYRRSQLVVQARIAASSLEQVPLPEIEISGASVDSPAYLQWKAILSLIARTGDYGFAYLLTYRDGQAVFLADSEEPNSEDESLIGDVWTEIPQSVLEAIRVTGADAVPSVVGPYRDEWGVWVSALVPVPGWQIDGRPVWLGVDREAYDWQSSNLRLRQVGLAALTLLILILLFSFAIHRVNLEARWRVAQSHMRLSLSLQGGNLIAWEYDPVQDRLQLQGEVERLGLTDIVPVMNLASFLTLLPPASASALRGEWDKLLRMQTDEIHTEFALSENKERKRWAALKGKVLSKKGNGVPLLIAGTLQDITENKEWEQRLREEKEAADAANRAKSTFLATMSHEIRTPLNAIIGMSSLLCRQELPPKSKDFVHTILDSGESLLNLINDILDYSKIEAGKIDLEQKPFSLGALLRELEGVFAQQAHLKGLKFSIVLGEGVPLMVSGDVTRLKQVLMNLLSNALKFTAMGEVTLHVKERPGAIISFLVKDTGIGLSAEEQARLFVPYQQADSSITRRYGGSGLGLVISKRLAELMGGSILVSSTPGSGSEFELVMPLRVAPGESLAPGEKEEKPENARVEDSIISPLRVLVAEDNPTNQKVIQAMFTSIRQKIQLVENGELAVEEAARQHYDLVLLDVQMPVMDGLQAARLIREAEKETRSHALIIALTANAFKEDREQCLAAGMDDYYAKPIKLDQLRQLLVRARDARSRGGGI